jgi:hypothetical protein
VLRFVGTLVAIFALYSLRAWYVLAGAFFGIVVLRGAYGLARDGEWIEAGLAAILGGWLLVVSYRWFALRWRSRRPSDSGTP